MSANQHLNLRESRQTETHPKQITEKSEFKTVNHGFHHHERNVRLRQTAIPKDHPIQWRQRLCLEAGDLRAAYNRTKTLCEVMGTHLNIHSYARDFYETVYQSGEFMSEPWKTVIAGCLFIAYQVTDGHSKFQERKISYRERSILAPATDQDVLRVFAALEIFFKFKATRALVGDGDEAMDQATVTKANERNHALEEDEDAKDADSIVDDSTKLLLAVCKRIDVFCKCFSMALPISSHLTAHSRFYYKKVRLSGTFEQDEQAAVLAGCFYLAFRQLGVSRTLREVWIVTCVPIEELEAVVKDLENFFAEEARLENTSEGRSETYAT